MRLKKTISVNELFDNFFDANASLKLCESCKNYGAMWSCPPFEKPIEIGKFKNVTLVLRRTENSGDFFQTFLETRKIFDQELLALEKEILGSVAFFGGSCANCELEECARKHGNPCPFPNMRSSLEAMGFDVVKIARNVFDVKIEWSDNAENPKNLTLVGALFFD